MVMGPSAPRDICKSYLYPFVNLTYLLNSQSLRKTSDGAAPKIRVVGMCHAETTS